MTKNRKRLVFGFSILFVIIIGILAVKLSHKRPEAPIKLIYGKVTQGPISNSVTATGTLEPMIEVEVGTQVSGIINKIYVDFNSHVKKGQLLAEMDKITLESEYTASEAEVTACKVEFEYQSKEFKRSKSLHQDHLISDAEFDLAFYNYEKSRSNYEKSKSNLNKVKRNLAYTQI